MTETTAGVIAVAAMSAAIAVACWATESAWPLLAYLLAPFVLDHMP